MLQSGAQRGAGREGLPGAGKGETADVGNGSLAVDGVETDLLTALEKTAMFTIVQWARL